MKIKLQPLEVHFDKLREETEAIKPSNRGGRPRLANPMSGKERSDKFRLTRRQMRQRCIAILDMETDPFDAVKKLRIRPFLAVLYSDNFDAVVIWEENEKWFCDRVIAAIEALPDEYTIYAHNGGKFDFMFLVHRLRGVVSFKGRGIMSARIGKHHLRDSFHIIPERLAAYQKEMFDYSKMSSDRRGKHKDEIITYCIADCKYLLDLVRKFVNDYGLKLSIGQAAMMKLKENYNVERFSAGFDEYVRRFYFGGRVECIRGRGRFCGDYKLFDVNSEYPFVMATYVHPVGGFHDYSVGDRITDDTVFIELDCTNRGGLINRGDNGETLSTTRQGRFCTTRWEYEVSRKYGLISDEKIISVLDCKKRTDFSKFVLPLYENRLRTKNQLQLLKSQGRELSAEYVEAKKDDIFYKLLLNNAYGKFAQNPRNFKEHYITDPGDKPPGDWFASLYERGVAFAADYLQPTFEGVDYSIWSKPSPNFRFNNVGTAASITGAARAVLLEAKCNATDPIYCDTDSLICRELNGVEIHSTKLGAWDLEDEFSEVIINGKKEYAVRHKIPKKRTQQQLEDGLHPEYSIKCKGSGGFTWHDFERLLHGEAIPMPNKAPTLTRTGGRDYITRIIRATAPILEYDLAA